VKDYLYLNKKLTVITDERMNNKTVKKLWNSFTLTAGEICFEGNTYSDCGWSKNK